MVVELGFRPGIMYREWGPGFNAVGETDVKLELEAKDRIHTSVGAYEVVYRINPPKNSESMIIRKLGNEQFSLMVNREDSQVTHFSSAEMREWEEANPERAKSPERFETVQRMFDFFYTTLYERYPIDNYLLGYDKEINERIKEVIALKEKCLRTKLKTEDELKEEFRREKEKRRQYLRTQPDPLESIL